MLCPVWPFKGVIMKFFTKLFLVVALLLPTVAGAENIAPINFNPSRSGWFFNLKVMSSLNFQRGVLQVNTLNIGGATPNYVAQNTLTFTGEQDATITTTTIHSKETADTSANTIRFSEATLSLPQENRLVEVRGGSLEAAEGFVTITNFGNLPVYADRGFFSEGTTLTVKGSEDEITTYRGNPAKPTPPSAKLKGIMLGKHQIPLPPAGSPKNLCWKDVTIGSTTHKVLVLTSSGC